MAIAQLSRRSWRLGVVLCSAMLVAACSGDDADDGDGATATPPPADSGTDEQRYPEVVAVDVEPDGGAYDFAVTISSPYDSPDRYADGWRIVGPDGTVYGEHELTHDHADEQPFTRTQRGVIIPPDVDQVTVEARDSQHGYGGRTVTVTLANR